MKRIVDTNVPVVANKRSPQASRNCVVACGQALRDIEVNGTLVLDDGWHILREYMDNLRSEGQPGIGDAFLKWALTNWKNRQRCEIVHITPIDDGREYDEFPGDEALAGFDPSDRKFVAVALAHPERPPVPNATDTDWRDYRGALAEHGVRVQFLCPGAMA